MGRIQTLQNGGDPILSSIARGYMNNDFIGEIILPPVVVEKEVGKIPLFGKENFLAKNTERALRAKSNRGDLDNRKMMAYELDEHDYEVALDYREKNAYLPEDLEAEAVENTMEIIKLRQEKNIADLIQDPATYPAGHVEFVGAGDKFNEPTSDPIAMIRDARSTVRSKIVKRPDLLVLSYDSYEALIDHPLMIERIKYSSIGVLNIDLLKQLFDVGEIVIGESVYSADGVTFTDLWKGFAGLFYRNSQTTETRTARQPRFGHTLRLRGMQIADKYPESGVEVAKLTVVRSTDLRQEVIVGAEAGFIFKDTLL
jgi:hypothetical protein